MSSDPRNNGEKTGREMPVGRRFQPGNPGRPKGSRNKLGEDVIEVILANWQTGGAEAIERTRVERPWDYMKTIVSILPKEIKIEHLAELTDEQLSARIRQLAADLGIAVGLVAGLGSDLGGTETPSTTH